MTDLTGGVARLEMTMTVNGGPVTVRATGMARLLDVLRDGLGLVGTKEGCGEGECGACAVLLDGLLVNSCLVPAAQADGATVLTIEGLAADPDLGPAYAALQRAMLAQGAAQCGFCSPGMVLAGLDLLRRNPAPDRDEAVAALSGNLCRCTGYARILSSVLSSTAPEARP